MELFEFIELWAEFSHTDLNQFKIVPGSYLYAQDDNLKVLYLCKIEILSNST